MSLSPRAQACLASMKRHSPVPVDEVAEALKRAGCPTFAPWLDFQARYGGSVEDLGKDEAIWGLLHREPYWLPPGEVQVDLEGDVRRITCAEVHPSYDFWLTSSGEFFSMGGGGHYENFNVRVERGAVFWEEKVRGGAWHLDWDVLKIVGSVEELRQRVRAEMVPEASDKYSLCWRSDELILVTGEDRPLVWVDANRREHLLSRLGSRTPR